jgi:hypothetical protein
MALTSTPFGFIPAYHPSGQIRSIRHQGILLPGANVAFYKGMPVKLVLSAGGTVQGVATVAGQVYLAPIAATTDPIYGVFAGCEYYDSTNRPGEFDFWAANTVTFAGAPVTAFIWTDPLIEYAVQGDNTNGAGWQLTTTLGDLYGRFDGRQGTVNTANVGVGSNATGLSVASLLGGYTNLVATTVQGQFQITTLDPTILNQTPGDPFPQFQVRISRPQTAAVYPSF